MNSDQASSPDVTQPPRGGPHKQRLLRIDPERLASDLATLSGVDFDALKDRWRGLYGSEPPSGIWRSLLVRAVAYKLQERALGGLKPATRRWLVRAADNIAAGRAWPPQPTARIKVGTRLLREWQGVTHEVAITEGGVLYRGQQYGSLSEVARVITGSRWSGPLFFGLKVPAKEAADEGR
jgi:hypothetical protein